MNNLNLSEYFLSENISSLENEIRASAKKTHDELFQKILSSKERTKLKRRFCQRKAFDYKFFKSLDVLTAPLDDLIAQCGILVLRVDLKLTSFERPLHTGLGNLISPILFWSSDGMDWKKLSSIKENIDESELTLFFKDFNEMLLEPFKRLTVPALENGTGGFVQRMLSNYGSKEPRYELLSVDMSDQIDKLIPNKKKFNSKLLYKNYPGFVPQLGENWEKQDDADVHTLDTEAPILIGHFPLYLASLKVPAFFIAWMMDPATISENSFLVNDQFLQSPVARKDYLIFRDFLRQMPVTGFVKNLDKITDFVETQKAWETSPFDFSIRTDGPRDQGTQFLTTRQYRYVSSLRRRTGKDLTKASVWENPKGKDSTGTFFYK